ncbi:MAG: sulfotransferase domain-containing protein, partial [Planctomycetes bacterium]|nr:sulfotransferase domain-containing protein [Planctomycetota bacterium]
MRLPDFLIIGAMKAGTTSLYRDLLANSAVFMPIDKEPWNLAGDDVCQPQGLRQYAKLFEKAKAHQVCGEASTVYSQLPDITGVPRRAREVLGDRLMVIYLVREPIERMRSMYRHLVIDGTETRTFIDALTEAEDYLQTSRYIQHIGAYLKHYSKDRFLVIT